MREHDDVNDTPQPRSALLPSDPFEVALSAILGHPVKATTTALALLYLSEELVKTAYAAVDAQRKADYWQQFQTHSPTMQRAEAKLEATLHRLESLDTVLAHVQAELTKEVQS